jgi:eukaryotic-like serine/threonine-protein kinase
MTLWDLPAATPRRRFPVRVGRVASLEFDARGERFAGPTLDGSVTVWDARTGAAKVTLEAAPTTLITAAFSPDGRLIAAAGLDSRTRVYDADTGALLSTIAHGGLFCAPQFSPDGARLVTAGGDGTAKVWDVSADARGPAALAAYVRCHVPLRLEGETVWPAAQDVASCQ